MNKRLIISILSLALTAGLGSPVLAKEDKPERERERQEAREEVKERQQNFLDLVASRSQQIKQTIQNRLTESRRNRATNWWEKALERLQKLIDRETRLTNKVQDRLDRLASEGKDVSGPRANLAASRTAIIDAQNTLNNAKLQAAAIISDPDNSASEIVRQLHDLHKGVIDKIRQAHRQLSQAVASIRSLSLITTPTPTPTTSQ